MPEDIAQGASFEKLRSLGITGSNTLRLLTTAANEAVAAVRRFDSLLGGSRGSAHFFVTRIVERGPGEPKDKVMWTPFHDRSGVVNPDDDFCRSVVNLLVPHAYKHARLAALALQNAARLSAAGGTTPFSEAAPAGVEEVGGVSEAAPTVALGGGSPSPTAGAPVGASTASPRPTAAPSSAEGGDGATTAADGRGEAASSTTDGSPGSTVPGGGVTPATAVSRAVAAAFNATAEAPRLSAGSGKGLVKVFRPTAPLVVRPGTVLVTRVTALMDKAAGISADLHAFKKASGWCIAALIMAFKTQGVIKGNVDLEREGRRKLMISLWARWWPCWESPQKLDKGSVPPSGTVNNLDGRESKLQKYSVWAMKVDAMGVRSTLGSEKAAALGWDSDVVTLKSLGRARDMPLSGHVAAVLLLGARERETFMPILQDCLEQDWAILFPATAARRGSSGKKATAGMVGPAAVTAESAVPPQTLPGADAMDADGPATPVARDAMGSNLASAAGSLSFPCSTNGASGGVLDDAVAEFFGDVTPPEAGARHGLQGGAPGVTQRRAPSHSGGTPTTTAGARSAPRTASQPSTVGGPPSAPAAAAVTTATTTHISGPSPARPGVMCPAAVLTTDSAAAATSTVVRRALATRGKVHNDAGGGAVETPPVAPQREPPRVAADGLAARGGRAPPSGTAGVSAAAASPIPASWAPTIGVGEQLPPQPAATTVAAMAAAVDSTPPAQAPLHVSTCGQPSAHPAAAARAVAAAAATAQPAPPPVATEGLDAGGGATRFHRAAGAAARATSPPSPPSSASTPHSCAGVQPPARCTASALAATAVPLVAPQVPPRVSPDRHSEGSGRAPPRAATASAGGAASANPASSPPLSAASEPPPASRAAGAPAFTAEPQPARPVPLPGAADGQLAVFERAPTRTVPDAPAATASTTPSLLPSGAVAGGQSPECQTTAAGAAAAALATALPAYPPVAIERLAGGGGRAPPRGVTRAATAAASPPHAASPIRLATGGQTPARRAGAALAAAAAPVRRGRPSRSNTVARRAPRRRESGARVTAQRQQSPGTSGARSLSAGHRALAAASAAGFPAHRAEATVGQRVPTSTRRDISGAGSAPPAPARTQASRRRGAVAGPPRASPASCASASALGLDAQHSAAATSALGSDAQQTPAAASIASGAEAAVARGRSRRPPRPPSGTPSAPVARGSLSTLRLGATSNSSSSSAPGSPPTPSIASRRGRQLPPRDASSPRAASPAAKRFKQG